jgi:hypothetical protein
MEALVKIATTSKSVSARVAASIAILDRAFGMPRQTLQAQNESNVQYFISDKPLTIEEWEAKYCTGNPRRGEQADRQPIRPPRQHRDPDRLPARPAARPSSSTCEQFDLDNALLHVRRVKNGVSSVHPL